MDKQEAERAALSVTKNTILANIGLAAIKLAAGLFARSSALVSDGANSLSDVVSTVIVMIGIKLGRKAPDKDHPYGHERFECVAAMILSAIIIFTGASMGVSGITSIAQKSYMDSGMPGVPALIAALVSMAVKELLYRYTTKAAKLTRSSALMAGAKDHRADVLSSLGGFIGVLGARLGAPVLDPLAAVVICGFIVHTGASIFIESAGKMTDKAADTDTENQIREIILSQNGVISIDRLSTRIFGERMYVDIEIGVDENMTLSKAHEVSHSVHDRLEEKMPLIMHCMVHVNPKKPDKKT